MSVGSGRTAGGGSFGSLDFRLALLAVTTSLAVQAAGFNSLDTRRRLQVTHSIWAGGPQVAEWDWRYRATGSPADNGFGVVGRGGRLYAPTGIGQSLVMLPADVAMTGLGRLAGVPEAKMANLREFGVAYATFPLIALATILVALRLLRELGFSEAACGWGCLGLLFASTFLTYCQSHQENSLIFLMALLGALGLLRWARGGSPRWLVAAGLALGFNFLVRVTTVFETGAICLFAAGVRLAATAPARGRLGAAVGLVRPAAALLAILSLFVAAERAYNDARFGTWTGTYHTLWSEQHRFNDPAIPEGFPYNGDFREGFFGAFFAPHKSVFLFDPLLVVGLTAMVGAWGRIGPTVRAWLAASAVALLASAAFYAPIVFWGGDVCWADRYLLTPVWFIVLVTPAILRDRWRAIGPARRALALGLAGLSVLLQVGSLVLPPQLECAQEEAAGHPLFVIGLRAANIATLATGRPGLPRYDGEVAGAEYLHVNLTPFLLGGTGEGSLVPPRVSAVVTAGWASLVAALAWQAASLVGRLRADRRAADGRLRDKAPKMR